MKNKSKIKCPECESHDIEIYSGPERSSNKEGEIIERTRYQCQKCFHLFIISIKVGQKPKP
jgi:transposase-like protein